MFSGRFYPRDMRAGPNTNQYRTTDEPAEQAFDLDESLPVRRPKSGEDAPPPPTPPPTDPIRVVPPERIPAPTPQN